MALMRAWLGKILDSESLSSLIDLSNKYRFNVDGEGGEYVEPSCIAHILMAQSISQEVPNGTVEGAN